MKPNQKMNNAKLVNGVVTPSPSAFTFGPLYAEGDVVTWYEVIGEGGNSEVCYAGPFASLEDAQKAVAQKDFPGAPVKKQSGAYVDGDKVRFGVSAPHVYGIDRVSQRAAKVGSAIEKHRIDWDACSRERVS